MIRVLLRTLLLSVMVASPGAAQEGRDVRQIVTFLFQPGRGDSARAVYERHLIPLYRQDTAMRRFRAYREAESPEPLDLVVVSSFAGLAGMDDSNAALRGLSSGGRPTFAWYGALAAMSQHHHDQLVTMLPELGDAAAAAADSSGGLVALEYVRVTPGAQRDFERLVRTRVRSVERSRPLVRWSETGRLLVSDGWDYVRFVGVSSLAAWEAYQEALRAAGVARDLETLVAVRKTILVRQEARLSVR